MKKLLPQKAVLEFLRASKKYDLHDAQVMPKLENLHLGEARHLNAVILYIDLRGSTKMSQSLDLEAQLVVLHTYLATITRLVKESGAFIEKYTGDGIMAIYPESEQMSADVIVSTAYEVAISVILTVKEVLNPVFKKNKSTTVACAAGMDYGSVLLARTGIRGENDLVTIGAPANLAAKIEDKTPAWKIGIGHAAHKILFPNKGLQRFLGTKEVTNYKYYIVGC